MDLQETGAEVDLDDANLSRIEQERMIPSVKQNCKR